MSEEKYNLTAAIRCIDVGEKKKFPIERLMSVRSIACALSKSLKRKYRCLCDSDEELVIVSRLK